MIPSMTQRADLTERMDAPDCPESMLLSTVRQFASINRWVSRYRHILKREVLADMQLDPARAYHLVDMGAGGCDIDAWLLHAAHRRGLKLRVTACEADPRIIRYAREQRGKTPGLSICPLDVVDKTVEAPVDYAFANHFLHHLPDERIVRLLKTWAPRVGRCMLFSDLNRHPRAYAGYALFSLGYRNSFAREDGLTSICRGFRAGELAQLAARAGLAAQSTVQALVPERLLLRIDCRPSRSRRQHV